MAPQVVEEGLANPILEMTPIHDEVEDWEELLLRWTFLADQFSSWFFHEFGEVYLPFGL